MNWVRGVSVGTVHDIILFFYDGGMYYYGSGDECVDELWNLAIDMSESWINQSQELKWKFKSGF